MTTTSFLETAKNILSSEQICDRCFGRCFAKLGTGLTNEERGKALRVLAAMASKSLIKKIESCSICLNHFEQIEKWAMKCQEQIKDFEFTKYLVGTSPPDDVALAEADLWLRYGVPSEGAEPFKQEFNRLVGKRLGQHMSTLGRNIAVAFQNPEIVFKIDLATSELQIEVHSLYIYGRYKKFVRTIPQTQWPCRRCKGRGCDHCSHTGKQYQESVGELIAAPVLVAAKSKEHAFHGAGREDIDARMLGTGRPFVLEIKLPQIRSLDLISLAAKINSSTAGKVEVGPLTFVSRKVVEDIKEGKAKKSYIAKVSFEHPIDGRILSQALHKLIGKISQQTPKRVLHRRADLNRTRQLFSASGELKTPTEGLLTLHCDGGLYIKELISGDQGRTTPSLSEALGVPALVTELDVIEVTGKFPDSL